MKVLKKIKELKQNPTINEIIHRLQIIGSVAFDLIRWIVVIFSLVYFVLLMIKVTIECVVVMKVIAFLLMCLCILWLWDDINSGGVC